jgi:hypothetical protein
VAVTSTKLGNVYRDLGDTRKKRKLLEVALAINEAHGLEYRDYVIEFG